MQVQVAVLFEAPGSEEDGDLRALASSLTNDKQSVRVARRDGDPRWLTVEFTMPTQPQLQAVSGIDAELRFYAGNRLDSAIGFPKSEAEQRRADRKNARQRARRKALREQS